MNKQMQCAHKMEYYKAIKSNAVLIHTTWMNFENMLNERNKS